MSLMSFFFLTCALVVLKSSLFYFNGIRRSTHQVFKKTKDMLVWCRVETLQGFFLEKEETLQG